MGNGIPPLNNDDFQASEVSTRLNADKANTSGYCDPNSKLLALINGRLSVYSQYGPHVEFASICTARSNHLNFGFAIVTMDVPPQVTRLDRAET